MPIKMTVDHKRRFVEAVAAGEVSLADIEEFLDAVVVAEALAYRKLFDGSASYGKYNDEEIMRLAARISAYSSLGQRGALALVTPPQYYEVAARFLNLDRPERPGRIFLDAGEARRWLETQPDVKD
jgi:hypothetical protein